MKNTYRFISLILVAAMLLCCGCKKEEIPRIEPIEGAVATPAGGEEAPVPTLIDVQDPVPDKPEDAPLTFYPEEDKNSFYMRFVEEVPTETFYSFSQDEAEEMEKYVGNPYVLEGTVCDIYSSWDELAAAFNISMIENASAYGEYPMTAFTLLVDTEKILVIDLETYLSAALKDILKDELMTLKADKTLYNDLKGYAKHPEKKEYIRLYGFYCGYDEDGHIPVFTYGIGRLTSNNAFGAAYARFRSDETVPAKFKNYVDFDKPVAWSDSLEYGNADNYYFDNGQISWYAYDDEEQSLEDFVDANMISFEDEHITILSQEYTSIAGGDTTAFRICYSSSGFEGVETTYSEIYIFPHKHRFIILELYLYTSGENGDAVLEDFHKMVDSVKLRAF